MGIVEPPCTVQCWQLHQVLKAGKHNFKTYFPEFQTLTYVPEK